MSKNSLPLRVGKIEKLILYSGPDKYQAQSLIDSSLAIPHLLIKFNENPSITF